MARGILARGSFVVVVSVLLLAFLSLLGCGQPAAPAAPAPKTEPAKPAPTQAPAAKTDVKAPAQKIKVRYAFIPNAGTPIIDIARDRKIYEEVGLDMEFIRFNSGPAQFAAMKSGDIELSDMSTMTALVGRSQGVDAKIFSLVYDLSPTNVLVVQPNSGIKSAKELKGKKIAAVQGSSSYFGLITYLTQAGMTIKDVEFLSMDGAAITPAFIKKDVDAAWHWAPWYNKMLEAGGQRVITNKEINAIGLEVVLARADWIKNNQEAARRMVEAESRVQKAMAADQDKFLKSLAEAMAATDEQAKQIRDVTHYITPDEMASNTSEYSLVNGYEDGSAAVGKLLKETAAFELKEGIVQQAIDVKGAIDPGPIKAWAGR